MFKIKIDHNKCCWKKGKCDNSCCDGGCSGCVEACPAGAITRDDVVKIDEAKCIGCGACVIVCKNDAISLE
ncbi:MAG: 4Fe-4S binding protein [bacterium]